MEKSYKARKSGVIIASNIFCNYMISESHGVGVKIIGQFENFNS